jgi:hypothetical protein
MRKKFTEEWRNCGWSETRQQHSKHETRRTMIQMTSKPVEFSQKYTRRGAIRGEMAKLWLEWNYDYNTASTKPERKKQGRKI